MVDPATAAMIAAAIGGAAKGGVNYLSSKKQREGGKLRAKEMQRETLASLLNDAFGGGADLQAHGMKQRSQLGRRRTQSLFDTADLVRGAFNI